MTTTTSSLVADYRTAEYRGFIWVQHEEYGFLLLHCTRKKSKRDHWQTPGGRIDDYEFIEAGTYLCSIESNHRIATQAGDRDSQLCRAGKLGAARELWEETGIDVRSKLERLIPARLRSHVTDAVVVVAQLPNQLSHRLFYILNVSDGDFPVDGEVVGAMSTVECPFRHLKLRISKEHSGFTFQSNVETVAQMLSLHSGGHISEALRMVWQVDPTQFGLTRQER